MTAAAPAIPSSPWLRSRNFDLFFILGVTALTLLCGAVIRVHGGYIPLIASLNVLLLASPHIITTYTRLCFNRNDAKKYMFLLVPLPLIVLGAVTLMAFSVGGWLITAVYLYWQWWHFVRQDYGISRIYLSKSMHSYQPHPLWDNYVLYALPLCGILYRSYQQPAMYLGREIHTLPVPLALLGLAGVLTSCMMAMQGWHWWKAYRKNILPKPYLLYVTSHYVVFVYCYMVLPNISYGWLAFNMWHNVQYICFVWLYNNQRLKSGGVADDSFLGGFSKEKATLGFVITIIVLALAFNELIGVGTFEANKLTTLLPWALIISMSTTFHHFTVDAIVWRRKRRDIVVA